MESRGVLSCYYLLSLGFYSSLFCAAVIGRAMGNPRGPPIIGAAGLGLFMQLLAFTPILFKNILPSKMGPIL